MDYKSNREKMVREQIISRGISDERVIEAMINVPREVFVPDAVKERAFFDGPLPIGDGQTISQPYIVAYMTELLQLKPSDKVLELGTGSGYQTAILSYLADKVISYERIRELHNYSKNILLEKLNLNNVILLLGDGTIGLKQYGLFEKIILTASPPAVPDSIINLLKDGGRLVAPIGQKYSQKMVVFKKNNNQIVQEDGISVAFVPLIGKYGWST
jgi:protein-L-isoaspartate(D-aspartate) O-methyltransferase